MRVECVQPDIDDGTNLFKMAVFWREKPKQEKIARIALESASLRLAALASAKRIPARCHSWFFN